MRDLDLGRWGVIYVRDLSDFIFCKRKVILRKLFPRAYELEGFVRVGKLLHRAHFLIHKFGIKKFARFSSDRLRNLGITVSSDIAEDFERYLMEVMKTHKGVKAADNIEYEVKVSWRGGKIRGSIDMVLNGLVYEVKFYRRDVSKPFPSDIVQAFLYGRMYKENRDYSYNYVVIEYPITGKEFKVDLKDESIMSIVENAINELIEASFSDRLPDVKRGRKCEFCEVRTLCWSL
ncbi:MAG: Dna2/Cas4 domain-containing protein [Candidatus Odinarchaeota archaeon]|nr:Dna2/Cas4 domain-containing protein [Candidatus Odinarchaeota archaeon]